MEEAYAEAYHPRSNQVVKICIPNNYEVKDFLDLPKLEITFVRLKKVQVVLKYKQYLKYPKESDFFKYGLELS